MSYPAMTDSMDSADRVEPGFWGLRMTAEEYLQIPDDGYNYELVDGVVQMSPSPEPVHQSVTLEVARQLANYLKDQPIGRAWAELDVHLGKGLDGGDIVYRPEVLFVRKERLAGSSRKLAVVPDLVVEVISHGSRRMDTQTKRKDYERFGVGEYWIMDPEREAMLFLRLVDGKFVEVLPDGDQFNSKAVSGFALDLALVREQFKPW